MNIYHAEIIAVHTESNVAVFSVIFEDEKGRRSPSRIVRISGNTGKVSPEMYQSFLEEFCKSPKHILKLAMRGFQERF
ncbi:hypothetical protein [Priestia megaterium]|uniref:hypothetical protein n=1 Tax=Priestia megaterium TaxID=1404 RepID=UPI000BF43268|nr:hypothetical protein [Priestia megaterium]PFR88892.1 hypothetical protein COK39_25615 [Priestia megaterium]